jgi:hypothetical protein
MELKDIVGTHLDKYVKEGAKLLDRIPFLILLFNDIKSNGIDLKSNKEYVTEILKIKFASESLDRLYEVCLLRDILKATSLVESTEVITPVVEKMNTIEPVADDVQPDDVPAIDMEVYGSRVADIDHDFLKEIGWKE